MDISRHEFKLWGCDFTFCPECCEIDGWEGRGNMSELSSAKKRETERCFQKRIRVFVKIIRYFRVRLKKIIMSTDFN
jgi:hypothetical protein